jgi:hypothetical protein
VINISLDAPLSTVGVFDDEVFSFDDTSRSDKEVSVYRPNFSFGTPGDTDNDYLGVNGIVNADVGHVMHRDATITAASFYYRTGDDPMNFDIRVNGGIALDVFSVAADTAEANTGLNIDIDAGDRLQVFIGETGPTGPATDAIAELEVAWRA